MPAQPDVLEVFRPLVVFTLQHPLSRSRPRHPLRFGDFAKYGRWFTIHPALSLGLPYRWRMFFILYWQASCALVSFIQTGKVSDPSAQND